MGVNRVNILLALNPLEWLWKREDLLDWGEKKMLWFIWINLASPRREGSGIIPLFSIPCMQRPQSRRTKDQSMVGSAHTAPSSTLIKSICSGGSTVPQDIQGLWSLTHTHLREWEAGAQSEDNRFFPWQHSSSYELLEIADSVKLGDEFETQLYTYKVSRQLATPLPCLKFFVLIFQRWIHQDGNLNGFLKSLNAEAALDCCVWHLAY